MLTDPLQNENERYPIVEKCTIFCSSVINPTPEVGRHWVEQIVSDAISRTLSVRAKSNSPKGKRYAY